MADPVDVEVATDDANRADGAIGSNWTIPSGVNAPVINGGRFQRTSGRNGALWTADAFDDDQYAAVTLTLVHNCASNSSGDALGGGIGVALRGSSDGDGYFVLGANNRTIVFARISGVDTVLYNSSPSWSDGDFLWAMIVGTTITVFQNDVQVAEVDASEAVISSGRPGMFFLGGNFGALRLDDWSAGNMVSESSDVAGDVDVTAEPATLSATGALGLSGSVAATAEPAAASGAGALTIPATADVQSAAAHLSATGGPGFSGAISVTAQSAGLSATGALAIGGAVDVATAPASLDAAGVLAFTGEIAVTAEPAMLTARQEQVSSLAAAPARMSATATLTLTSTATVSAATAALAATGSLSLSGTIAVEAAHASVSVRAFNGEAPEAVTVTHERTSRAMVHAETTRRAMVRRETAAHARVMRETTSRARILNETAA